MLRLLRRAAELPWFALLLAIWPVLHYWGRNRDEVDLGSGLRWSLGAATGCALLLVLAWPILRSLTKAGLPVALILAACLGLPALWTRAGEHSIAPTLVGAGLAVGLAAAALRRSRGDWTRIATIANVVALALVIQALVPFAAGEGRGDRASRQPLSATLERPALSSRADAPDLYYLILDGYARHDVLARFFALDNEPFLQELEELGFTVARRSRSNYAQTRLSLASSLNMAHLEQLAEAAPAPRTTGKYRRWAVQWIEQASVVRALRDLGYRIHLATSIWEPTGHIPWITDRHECRAISELGTLLVEKSAFTLLEDHIVGSSRRRQILCQFDTVERLAAEPGPKFVLAHIILPHGPYLFGPDGQQREPASYLLGADEAGHGYADQVRFANRRLLATLRAIDAATARPWAAIVHGDHGAWYPNATPQRDVDRSTEAEAERLLDANGPHAELVLARMAIFNAYRFPGVAAGALYDEISPVNSFRVLFNTYFDARLELEPDTSWFSTYKRPQRLFDVTATVRAAGTEVAAGPAHSP